MRFTRIALAAAALGAATLTGSANASNAIAEASACPDGYTGVIVTVAGKDVTVCQNLGGIESCPKGLGARVEVGSRYVSACLSDLVQT